MVRDSQSQQIHNFSQHVNTIAESEKEDAYESGRKTEQITSLQAAEIRLRNRIKELEEKVIDSQNSAQYRYGMIEQQLKHLSAATIKLDIDLQREMRDLIANVQTELRGLDARFQGELTNTITLLQSTIDKIERDAERNGEWQTINRAQIATMTQQIKQILESYKAMSQRPVTP